MNAIRNLLIGIGVVALAGCTGSPDDGNSNSGTVRGQMTDGAGFAPVSGATMTAFKVEADGSLTAVSDSVESDANGEYELTVTFETESISDIVVQGEGQAEGSAIVSATITDGSQVSAPPIDGETSVEAHVYISAKASGNFDSETSGTSYLRSQIDADLAAEITASAQYEADVMATAAALAAGMKARAEMLMHASVGVAQSSFALLLEAEAQAQADLDAALHAASTTAEAQAAIDVYFNAMADAYADAGITLAQAAQSAEAQATASANLTAALSTSVQESLRVEVERARVEVIAAANEASFVALAASQQLQDDVAAAGDSLDAAIQASAGAQAQIDAAWGTYNAYVQGELQAHLEASYAGASNAIDGLQTEIDAARGVLETAISTTGNDVSALVDAYGTFSAAVEASITGDATLGQLVEAELEATVSIVLNANLNG